MCTHPSDTLHGPPQHALEDQARQHLASQETTTVVSRRESRVRGAKTKASALLDASGETSKEAEDQGEQEKEEGPATRRRAAPKRSVAARRAVDSEEDSNDGSEDDDGGEDDEEYDDGEEQEEVDQQEFQVKEVRHPVKGMSEDEGGREGKNVRIKRVENDENITNTVKVRASSLTLCLRH